MEGRGVLVHGLNGWRRCYAVALVMSVVLCLAPLVTIVHSLASRAALENVEYSREAATGTFYSHDDIHSSVHYYYA